MVEMNLCTLALIFFYYIGQPFQSEYVHLEDCRIRPELLHIIVDCGYSSTSLATGFQVAVHCYESVK